MLSLYNAALLPLRPVVAAWAFWRALSDPGRSAELRERRARVLPELPPGGIWIHGASAGEARIVTALAAEVRREEAGLPLAASTYTPAGRAALPGPPELDAAFFLPFDFRSYVRRVLDAVRPSCLALVETELWPNLLGEAHRAGVPVVVLNGRLSAERMSRYRRLSRLLRPLLARIVTVGAQSEKDAQRFLSLGVPERAVEVLGNIKYDLPRPDVDPAALRARLRLEPGRPVLVAGSTGIGEEPLILDIHPGPTTSRSCYAPGGSATGAGRQTQTRVTSRSCCSTPWADCPSSTP
jgi:3-deoxy-D-manno-octulosonic-acid transferase